MLVCKASRGGHRKESVELGGNLQGKQEVGWEREGSHFQMCPDELTIAKAEREGSKATTH